uniref:Uncharacterized protein n=1 Tax=Cacopsylla melanoneura TaxID=428564 RepID=A0A8D8S8U6_9HEMI
MKLQNFEFCSIKPEYRFVNNIMYFRRIGPRSSLPASLSEPLGRGSYFRTFLERQETFDSCLFISNHFIPLWRQVQREMKLISFVGHRCFRGHVCLLRQLF